VRLTGEEALEVLRAGQHVLMWDPLEAHPQCLLPIEVEVLSVGPEIVEVVTATGKTVQTFPGLGFRYEHII
jgi:hypothetical protein